MKVKFKKPHALYSYFPGDVADLDDDLATKLIDAGFATDKIEEADPEITGTETSTLKPGKGK